MRKREAPRQRDVQIHYGDGAMASRRARARTIQPGALSSQDETAPCASTHTSSHAHSSTRAPARSHRESYGGAAARHEARRRHRERKMVTAGAWLQQARREAQCHPRLEPRHGMGNCEGGGSYGSLLIETNGTWKDAARACLARCAGCTACRHISVSLQPPVCNWYSTCGDPPAPTGGSGANTLRDRQLRRSGPKGFLTVRGFRSGSAFPAGFEPPRKW